MVGKYDITVTSNKVTYKLQIDRNITVLRGNSAIGKQHLIRLIHNYNAELGTRGKKTVSIDQKAPCIDTTAKDVVLNGQIDNVSGKIVFIDEQNEGEMSQPEFARKIEYSDNYFVLITRQTLANLQYSIKSLLTLKEIQGEKYPQVKSVVNIQKAILDSIDPTQKAVKTEFKPGVILVEDSRQGLELIKIIVNDNKQVNQVRQTFGKANVCKNIRHELNYSKYDILAIVGGAAFGCHVEELLNVVGHSERVKVLAPESMEFWILASGVVGKSDYIRNRVYKTYDYADSRNYNSWEEYYTKLLTSICGDKNTHAMVYHKQRLQKLFKEPKSIDKIKQLIPRYICL